MLIFALSVLGSTNVVYSDYPVRPVWDAFVSFCGNSSSSTENWEGFQPLSGTPLSYLAGEADEILTRSPRPIAFVYHRSVAGRELFAFKRSFMGSDKSVRSVRCYVYDFKAADRLDLAGWSEVTGNLSDVRQYDFYQEAGFGVRRRTNHLRGRIELHEEGMMPNPDSIGFIGLQLAAFSEEHQ